LSISILIICIAIQRLLLFDRYAYQLHWLESYFNWLVNKVEYITEGHALVGVLILILPVIILFSLLFSMIYHSFGITAYYVANLILVWLCMDARNLSKKPYSNIRAADLFILTYERLFAVIFWFVVLGPSGLILYTATISLRNYLLAANHQNLLFYVMRIKALLDWAPIRLLGLSYAITGHFSSVFRLWPAHLRTGLSADSRLAVEYGCAALGINENILDKAQAEIVQLIDRALLFWLLVIGLLTLAFWMG
jgi:AmpE protein